MNRRPLDAVVDTRRLVAKKRVNPDHLQDDFPKEVCLLLTTSYLRLVSSSRILSRQRLSERRGGGEACKDISCCPEHGVCMLFSLGCGTFGETRLTPWSLAGRMEREGCVR